MFVLGSCDISRTIMIGFIKVAGTEEMILTDLIVGAHLWHGLGIVLNRARS